MSEIRTYSPQLKWKSVLRLMFYIIRLEKSDFDLNLINCPTLIQSYMKHVQL